MPADIITDSQVKAGLFPQNNYQAVACGEFHNTQGNKEKFWETTYAKILDAYGPFDYLLVEGLNDEIYETKDELLQAKSKYHKFTQDPSTQWGCNSSNFYFFDLALKYNCKLIGIDIPYNVQRELGLSTGEKPDPKTAQSIDTDFSIREKHMWNTIKPYLFKGKCFIVTGDEHLRCISKGIKYWKWLYTVDPANVDAQFIVEEIIPYFGKYAERYLQEGESSLFKNLNNYGALVVRRADSYFHELSYQQSVQKERSSGTLKNFARTVSNLQSFYRSAFKYLCQNYIAISSEVMLNPEEINWQDYSLILVGETHSANDHKYLYPYIGINSGTVNLLCEFLYDDAVYGRDKIMYCLQNASHYTYQPNDMGVVCDIGLNASLFNAALSIPTCQNIIGIDVAADKDFQNAAEEFAVREQAMLKIISSYKEFPTLVQIGAEHLRTAGLQGIDLRNKYEQNVPPKTASIIWTTYKNNPEVLFLFPRR